MQGKLMNSDREGQEGLPEIPRSELLWMTLLVEGGIFITGVLLAYFLDYPFWENITLSARSLLLGVVATIPMLIVVITLYSTDWQIGTQLRKDFDLAIPSIFQSDHS
jgi:formate-dependent nitrite reductase membrane component NrfD